MHAADLITFMDVARALGVKCADVHRLVESKQLRAVGRDQIRFVLLSSLESYLLTVRSK